MISETTRPAEQQFIRTHGLDTVEGAFAFEGGEDLSKPGLGRRRRTRICFDADGSGACEMYLKRYEARPWWQAMGRMLRGRGRCGEAVAEAQTIRRLRDAGVPTMRALAWGQEARIFGGGRNYCLVSAVPGDALERTGDDFLARHGHRSTEMETLTAALVHLVRRLHGAGYVHRDLYASHIFLEEGKDGLTLSLIDLARVFRPRWRRFRWFVKDLAQLKYSMPWMWVAEQWPLFLMGYLDSEKPRMLKRWQRAVDRKVSAMQRQRRRRERRRKETNR